LFIDRRPVSTPKKREGNSVKCERFPTTLPPSLGKVRAPCPVPKGHVPKRNYGFEKRQKELAKLQKREQKAQKRAERAASPPEPEQEVPPTDPLIPPEE